MSQLETTPFSQGFVALALEQAGYDPADAKQAGVYAIKCNHPTSDLEALTRRWLAVFESTPDYLEEVATASDVAYVGASNHSVFDRLIDHADGEKRKARFLQVFEPVELLTIWPDEDALQNERQYAYQFKREHPEWCVVCDGEPV